MPRAQSFHFPVVIALGLLGLLTQTPMPATAQSHAAHTMASPVQLKWVDVPSLPPGAKMAVLEGPMNQAVPFTARLRLPANYRIPAHWHPAVERVSVLSGTFYMGLGDVLDAAQGTALAAGGFAVMPAKAPHFAYTAEEPAEVQLHGTGPWGITYLDASDDPRRKQQ
jgi:hypothetical protein